MKIKVVIAVFQNLPNMEKNGKPQPIIKSNEREEQKMCQKCNDSNCKDKCAKCVGDHIIIRYKNEELRNIDFYNFISKNT